MTGNLGVTVPFCDLEGIEIAKEGQNTLLEQSFLKNKIKSHPAKTLSPYNSARLIPVDISARL